MNQICSGGSLLSSVSPEGTLAWNMLKISDLLYKLPTWSALAKAIVFYLDTMQGLYIMFFVVLFSTPECGAGLWGPKCDQQCPQCSNGGICHDDSGECICPPGFTGQKCQHGNNTQYLFRSWANHSMFIAHIIYIFIMPCFQLHVSRNVLKIFGHLQYVFSSFLTFFVVFWDMIRV